MRAEQGEALELFYSYADEDEVLQKELEKQLSLLQRQGFIRGWNKREIKAGTNEADEIAAHLKAAHIVLLLVSPDFIASEYCYGIEMMQALERHKAGKAHVIPVILRPADWKGTPFGKLSPLPSNATPVTLWRDRDEVLLAITQGIRKVVEDLRNKSLIDRSEFQPIWNVPYRRNPFFSGRENLLKHLRDQLMSTKDAALTQAQAISGLGGIGKTQTAVEYAYRYRDKYQAVLWARAATLDTLMADFLAMADLLHLPEKDEPDQDVIVAAVKRRLESTTNWLLILDNADDIAIVYDFLPEVGSGHILLTTCAQFTGAIACTIEVEKMDKAEGTLLLLRRARCIANDALLDQATQADRNAAEAIVVAMDGLPLALDQAGAYIDETSCGLAGYLDLYRTCHQELLGRYSKLPTDHPEPVATTWLLSFQKVERASPAAADLLRLCAFLDPDAIPEEIITEGASYLGAALAPVAADPFKLNEAMEVLRRFSLIRRNSPTKTLIIHRLVQVVIKDGMNKRTKSKWAERAVRAVNRVFPTTEASTWPQCKRCLLQAQTCATLIDQYGFRFPEAARLLDQAASYLHDHALNTQAEPLYQRALSIKEAVLAPDNLSMTTTLNNLAKLYRDQGQYAQAEPLLRRALAIYEKRLESDSPDTATCLGDLAELYLAQGQYAQAEPLLRRALAIYEKRLGPNHPETTSSLYNLALLYDIQGENEQAELLYQRTLAISQRVLGPQHPDTLAALENYAYLLRKMQRNEEAATLEAHAITIREGNS